MLTPDNVYGQYGYYYEYDENGRTNVTTFIDSEGNPMISSLGYSTVKRTYDAINGNIDTEMYYDDKGTPIALIKDQYGVRFDGIDQVYLDRNGKKQFSLYTLLYNNPLLVFAFALIICALSMVLSKKGNIILLIGCVIEGNVVIGDDTEIHHHVVIRN